MTTITDPHTGGLSSDLPLVTSGEPPFKPPPVLAVGPLAWMRKNLFRSWFDTILTLVSTLVIVSVITGILNWVITQANWYAIIFNLRLFMLGRYELEYEWRVQVVVLIIAFTIGVSTAAWTRLPRALSMVTVVLLALTFLAPALITRTVPLPPAYLVAGQPEIVSGSTAEVPQEQLAFIARGGETLSVRVAGDLSGSDAALTGLYSFADIGANLLRATAQAHLDTQARRDEIDRLLAEDASAPVLTPRQREALTAEREKLEILPPTVETYRLNSAPVNVRILDGATLEPVAQAELSAGGDPLRVTLPADGWYIIDKQVTGDDGAVALLETRGIYPLLERAFTRGEVLDEEGKVVSVASRTLQYARMTDNFTIEAPRPTVEGDNVPMAVIVDMQYRNDVRPVDFLRLYLAPLCEGINMAFLLAVAAVAAGYGFARLSDRALSPRVQPRRLSRRLSIWLLTASPFLLFIFVYGAGAILPVSDTRRWGGLLLTLILTVVGIIASFPLGVLLALGRRSHLPVISAASTIYIEFVRGVPLITVLFVSQLLVPLVNPALAAVPSVFRTMIGITLFSAAYLAENVRGGLQAVPPGQEEAAKALGMQQWRITLYITLPQALRAVIPALVGQFISLMKDTSLVAIVGLLDLTGIAEAVVAQTEFLGLRRETYLLITLIYFVFSYVISSVARRIETSGVGAARRV